MEVSPGVIIGLEIAGPLAFKQGIVRRRQIGRAAQQPGDVWRYLVEHFPRRCPAGHPLRVGGERSYVGVPSVGQVAPLDPLQLSGLLGILDLVLVELRGPLGVQLLTPRSDSRGEVFPHFVGHEELFIFRPAVDGFGKSDFLIAQRRSVGVVATRLVRRAETDDAAGNDQRGPAGRELLAQVVQRHPL